MAVNWKMPGTTRSGRVIKPTLKVRQLIRQTVTASLRDLSGLLEDAEYQLRDAMRAKKSGSEINQLYLVWTDLQQEFVASESELANLLDPEELSHHRAMFQRKLDLQEKLVSDVEVYFRALKTLELGAGAKVEDAIISERQRLEQEIRELETKLSASRVSSEDTGKSPGECKASFHPPKHSTPHSYPSYITAPIVPDDPQPTRVGGGPPSPIVPRLPPAPVSAADPLQRLVDLLENNQRDRLPQLEPEVFTGDIMAFPDWLGAFESLVEKKAKEAGDLLFYLGKYTSGEAKHCISGMLRVRTMESYRRAKATLVSRFGNKFRVAEAYRRRLFQWTPVKKGDGKGLQTFTDYLWQCHATLESIGHLAALNSPEEIVKIFKLVPGYLADRWDRFVDRWCYASAPDYSSFEIVEEKGYPPFVEVCKFLSQEARVATGPGKIFASDGEVGTGARSKDAGTRSARAFDTESEEVYVHASQTAGENRAPVTPRCFYCKESHWLPDCTQFRQLTGEKRRTFAKDMGLCFGCLRRSHLYRECRNRDPALLADGPDTAATLHTQLIGSPAGAEEEGGHCSSVVLVHISHVSQPGRSVPVYALLDSQSDSCFLTGEILEKLGVGSTTVDLKLTTMGACCQVRSQRVKGLVITGANERVPVSLPKCYTREEIPSNRGAIARREVVKKWSHLAQVARELPDYQPEVPVGLLVGFNCPAAFIPKGCAQAGERLPFGVLTSLGWSVMGACGEKSGDGAIVNRTVAHEVRRVDFSRAFDLDFATLPDDERLKSQNERLFRARVSDSLHRTDDGHYEMDLPFREDPVHVPNNREMALRRLMQLKKRLLRDADYAKMYGDFMAEMVSSGYAEETTDAGLDGRVLFSPHHGVEHPLKPGKVRPVFDAQALHKGVSLNSLLLPGSEDPNNLAGVLCNFRDEKVGFMCDVKQMFYQVRVSEHHRDFLRYLWFRNGDPNGEIVEYRMCVHIFGATSSPSCANVAFRQNADDAADEFSPEVINFIKRQFYVDDGLNSRPSADEVVKLFLESHRLCQRGGFLLCKFTCNDEEAIRGVPDELLGKGVREWKASGSHLPVEMSLGLIWDMVRDAFRFIVKAMTQPMTRRGMLSGLSGIYDPLGLIAPVILVGRMILQGLCTGALPWDAPVTGDTAARWEKWHEELGNLASLSIPRCIRTSTSGRDVKVTLHHFSDASTRGYGVCSYAVLEDEDGHRDVALVYSKARVAPKKPVTMPRMELQAAVLAVKSSVFLDQELLYSSISHRFWSDSKVVLGYICNAERRFHLYVANRVSYIREHCLPSQWGYVRTDLNPADLASRGCSAADLGASDLWWRGPSFITEDGSPDTCKDAIVLDDDPEVKAPEKIVLKIGAVEEYGVVEMVERFSCWKRAARVLSRCLLFGRKLLHRTGRRDGEPVVCNEERLTTTLLSQVETIMLRSMQARAFPAELAALGSLREGSSDAEDDRVRQRCLKKTSSLSQLDVFVDGAGLLRVGGRLRNADLPYAVRHPILLARYCHLTTLIVRAHHVDCGHLGRLSTLSRLRESGYWVIAGRTEVDRCTRRCVLCRRMKSRGESQKMADLPEDRTEGAEPFTFTGADVFGPYIIKERRVERKRWVCMFTCLAIRAVQLEPLFSLSADSFLHAFRLLVNRRGPVKLIRCDCGTNFVGARGELRAAFEEEEKNRIREELLAERCDWTEFRFNVPKASHMGGVWERPIGTAKTIISGILKEHPGRLNDETFATFLTEAEGAMNCRPITCFDEGDPFSEPPLCPSQLLTLKRNTVSSLPGRFPTEDVYARKEWRRVQALRQLFMSRWRREYLLAMQKRQKWEKPKYNLRFGDVVLMMEEGVARDRWPLAVVAQLLPSADGLVRKVQVRTPSSQFDRPIHKLVYLFSPDDPLALPCNVIGADGGYEK